MTKLNKILASTAFAAALPLTAFAATDESVVIEGNEMPASEAAQLETLPTNGGNNLDQITLGATDLDSLLADATMVTPSLNGSQVVSEDRKLVGSVEEVYQKASGLMLAQITIDSSVDTREKIAMVPVDRIDESGTLVMSSDFEEIRNAFIQNGGYVAQD